MRPDLRKAGPVPLCGDTEAKHFANRKHIDQHQPTGGKLGNQGIGLIARHQAVWPADACNWRIPVDANDCTIGIRLSCQNKLPALQVRGKGKGTPCAFIAVTL